jgi:hypothetical protein
VTEWLDKNNAGKPRKKAPDRELLARLRQYCESFDMSGIDKVMLDLDKFDYDEDADLMEWIREKLIVSEIDEIAQRIAQY